MDTRRARLSWSFLGLGAIACVAYLLLHTTAAEPVAYLAAAAAGLTASTLGAALVRGPRRRVWLTLAAGQMLYLSGD